MRSMVDAVRRSRAAGVLAAALALAACGGGERQNEFDAKRVIALGDETSVIVDLRNDQNGNKYGVNAVFAGHEHFYERLKPQKGIYYFISGAGGKLRPGDVKDNSPLTAKAFDKDMSFMLLEIVGDQMHFQVISRTGETVDSGVLTKQAQKSKSATN